MARWIVDNGHAWLEVSMAEVMTAGIGEQISGYSYIDPRQQLLYLEEDCDALLYMTATNTKARDFHEHIIDGLAWCRNLPRITTN